MNYPAEFEAGWTYDGPEESREAAKFHAYIEWGTIIAPKLQAGAITAEPLQGGALTVDELHTMNRAAERVTSRSAVQDIPAGACVYMIRDGDVTGAVTPAPLGIVTEDIFRGDGLDDDGSGVLIKWRQPPPEMTVGRLIEHLKMFNPNLPVVVPRPDLGYEAADVPELVCTAGAAVTSHRAYVDLDDERERPDGPRFYAVSLEYVIP